jgi:hypothetical protein
MLNRATFDLNGVKHHVSISGIMGNQIFINLHDPVSAVSKFRITVNDESFSTEAR